MLAAIFTSCKKDGETTDTTETEAPATEPAPELDLYEVSATAAQLSVMTFNVTDSGMNDTRLSLIVETIAEYMPDIVGLQECSVETKDYLMQKLGGYYEYVGIGRDANGEGLSAAILYAKEKMTLTESGTKWLSNTPNEVSSLDGTRINYTYTWAKFKLNDGTEFMHVNTQFGDKPEIREKQARMILDFMWENKDIASVVTGDFNCSPKTKEFQIMMQEFMRHAYDVTANKSTGSYDVANIQDTFLIYDKYMDVTYFAVENDRIDGQYASSSRAMYIELKIDYNGTEYEESVDGPGPEVKVDRDGQNFSPFIPFH